MFSARSIDNNNLRYNECTGRKSVTKHLHAYFVIFSLKTHGRGSLRPHSQNQNTITNPRIADNIDWRAGMNQNRSTKKNSSTKPTIKQQKMAHYYQRKWIAKMYTNLIITRVNKFAYFGSTQTKKCFREWHNLLSYLQNVTKSHFSITILHNSRMCSSGVCKVIHTE